MRRGAAICVSVVAGVVLALVGPTFGAVGTYSGGPGIEKGTTYQFSDDASGRHIARRSGVLVCDVGPTVVAVACITSHGEDAAYSVSLPEGHYFKVAVLVAPDSRLLCHAYSPDGPILIEVDIESAKTVMVDWYCRVQPLIVVGKPPPLGL